MNLIERLRDCECGTSALASARIQELEAVIKSHGIYVKTATGGEAHYMMGDVERDASRYRYIRKGQGHYGFEVIKRGAMTHDKWLTGKKLDAAIDVAMKEQP